MNKKIVGIVIISLILITLVICKLLLFPNEERQAKYIFYFIGDGMGISHIALTEAYLSENKETLVMSEMPVTGLASTFANNRYITGSAAAGTALSTGQKTNVDMVGMTPDGQKLMSIAKIAKNQGFKVGIVSSANIDDATPSAFYANVSHRSEHTAIGDQLPDSGLDYFAGGTLRWDRRAESEGSDIATAYNKYKRRAQSAGFNFVTTRSEFEALEKGAKLPVIATLNMLSDGLVTSERGSLPYAIDTLSQSWEDDISLADFTAKGIELLEGDEGFLMVVEAGKIDWASHLNDAAALVHETIAFDNAISEALKFAEKYPDQTLIVVTADHECGGLTLGFSGTGYNTNISLLSEQKESATIFIQNLEELLADGADFEQVFEYTCDVFGFRDDIKDGDVQDHFLSMELTDFQVKLLEDAFERSINPEAGICESQRYYGDYTGLYLYANTCTQILNRKAGIDFSSYKHTATPVPIFAIGYGQEEFTGYYDISDIPKKIIGLINSGR